MYVDAYVDADVNVCVDAYVDVDIYADMCGCGC